VPTETRPATDPQRDLLSTVRQSQTAVIEAIRTWTTITEQLTRTLRMPVPDVDFAGAVDRVFDAAEQTLAVQRQLALTVAGVATRQVDTAAEAVGTAVTAVETTVGERVRQIEDRIERPAAEREQQNLEQPQAPTGDTSKAEPATQNRKFDGRTYEERTVEELRERAGELEIEGRSTMSKDELIAALRRHRQSRSANRSQAPKPDRRSYEDRSIEELRERARELEIQGRSTMSKDELIAALREQAK
jgi:hypothetical protein